MKIVWVPIVVALALPAPPAAALSGYIDKSGKIVIEPRFAEALDFSDGLAGVRTDKKFGYIDQTGAVVIAPQFDEVAPFREGIARVRVGEAWGFIDKSGKWIAEPQFRLASDFSEGLAAVAAPRAGETRLGWGYIDAGGKMAIAPQFYEAHSFSNGLAMVRRTGGATHIVSDAFVLKVYKEEEAAGFIDKSGKMAIAPQFMNAMSFSDGLACVQLPGGKSAYIDPGGKVVIDLAQWAADPFGGISVGAASFREGLAFVDTASGFVHVPKWGYIDKSGKIAAALDVSSSEPFSEGLALVGKGKLRMTYGYANREGKVVIPHQYRFAQSFSEGLAAVKIDSRWGYIDASGKVVIEPRFDFVGPFSGGLARVTIGR